METADPPFTQAELLHLVARRLGTLGERMQVRPQVTARELGLGPDGTQRVQRLLNGKGVLHWDEAWRIYQLLGWINEAACRRDLQQERRSSAREEAAAAEKRAQGVRARRRQGA